MGEKLTKLLNLLLASDRLDRLKVLAQIRLDRGRFDHAPDPAATITFDAFLRRLEQRDPALFHLIKPDGEAAGAVREVRSDFERLTANAGVLPFPTYFNADWTLGLLSYGLTRRLRPELAIETGVGYGITSALVLLAMERNGSGRLASIDLPPLSDPTGRWTGRVVPERLRPRWKLLLGSSRRRLRDILDRGEPVGLFVCDSANVYTLQRFEIDTVYPRLAAGGAALVNNVGAKFQAFLRSIDRAECDSLWQVDKPASATAVLLKR
jgi:hypothetical protein